MAYDNQPECDNQRACAFLKVGDNKPCRLKPTKKSQYCRIHNFLIKTSQVKPCLGCGKGTCSKFQICNKCGAISLRAKIRYQRMKGEADEYQILSQVKAVLTKQRNSNLP